MTFILALLISWTIGLLIIKAALKERMPGTLFSLFLSGTVGLGTSGLLTFSSFVLFDRLIPWFIIVLHLAIISGLALVLKKNRQLDLKGLFKPLAKEDIIALSVILCLTIPMVLFASLYPHGGWDAWGFWNTKARFLYLGGTSWTNMFDPVIWRTQVLYPFLLPLINTWGWCFTGEATYIVPLSMTCLIPLLTAGMLYSGLKELTGRSYALIAPILLFTHMFIIQLSASQYSDLLLGLFLLSAMTLFLLFQRSQNPGYLLLMGLCLGMLAFTKVEGLAISALTFITATLLILTNAGMKKIRRAALARLWAATALAAIPIAIFAFFYAPSNGRIFINGLTSADAPTSIQRLMVILQYYGLELISPKWNALWLILGSGLILGGKNSLRREIWLIPIVLGGYILVFTGTYAINTFYEIIWWLNTSLNRIIFALLPTMALWTFTSLEKE